MSLNAGPHEQMKILSQQMANRYHKDVNLELQPFLAHYMDEVEINILADRFDHIAFMETICAGLGVHQNALPVSRREHFLQAVKAALESRIQQL